MVDKKATPWYRRSYLTEDGKKALLAVGAVAAAACGTVAFLVKPRTRDWQNTAQWKNFERYRYAHRGLFDEPVSAQAYPKGTKGDPFRGTADPTMTAREQVARVKDKVTKNPDAPVATPLWADDVKDYPTLVPENSLPAFPRRRRGRLRRGAGRASDQGQRAGRRTRLRPRAHVRSRGLRRGAHARGALLLSPAGHGRANPHARAGAAAFRARPRLKRRHPPVLVDIKSTVGNCADITRLTLLALDRFDIDYVIESFDPRVLLYLRRNRPDIMRGQLSRDYLRGGQRRRRTCPRSSRCPRSSAT